MALDGAVNHRSWPYEGRAMTVIVVLGCRGGTETKQTSLVDLDKREAMWFSIIPCSARCSLPIGDMSGDASVAQIDTRVRVRVSTSRRGRSVDQV
jgi:hypothetical protein